MTWKETDIKSVCWLLSSIINLEKLLYTRFEIIQELMKEVLNRKNDLTQLEIVRLIEAMINLEQTGGLMMASQLQILLAKSIDNIVQTGSDIKSPDNDTTSLFFLNRFWGNFVQIPNSDKIIQEELLKKSMEYLLSQI